MTTYVWLLLTVAFAVLEAITVQLVCIWFSGGALFALISGYLGVGLAGQIAVFIIVSAILLLFTRPVVKKLLTKKDTATNLDRVIGRTVIITEKVDNLAASGKCSMSGVTWSVKSADDTSIETGEQVTVERIEGVHLIVKRK